MSLRYTRSFSPLILGFLLVFILAFAAACTPSSSGSDDQATQGEADTDHEDDTDREDDTDHEEDMDDEEHMDHEEDTDHDEDMDHEDEHEHEGEGGQATIPNDGAVIRLVSPADNAAINASDEFLVEVEVENFPLGEDGNHWHIEIDDVTYVMVVGQNKQWSVRGLEPGEHEISVYLSNGAHEQLKDGDNITITVEE
jgi:uncharacterized protein involved in copper resistance